MAVADDIISAFVRMIADESPQTPRIDLMRIESKLRQDWGGRRVYVGKMLDSEPQPKAERDCSTVGSTSGGA